MVIADVHARVWELLAQVPDPEVPVLSVVDLGIVRDVEIGDDGVTVVITPTYSGCPAMRAIEEDILRALSDAGIADTRIRTVLSPAWTSDWISESGKARLREYGIAAPEHLGPAASGGMLVPLQRRTAPVHCPYCDSSHTTMRSEFGSTACKATLFCESCRQPFELFKAI